MKLLDWVHRKFKQNNTGEPFKDFGIGHSCNCLVGQPSLDEQKYFQNYYYGSRPSKCHKLQKSFTRRAEGEDYSEEEYSDYAESEHFNGLLTIGTLGSDTVFLGPETPTFPATVEDLAEKETSVTENDLRLVNDELEKVFNADVKNEKMIDSSGRSSHVSTITLSGTDGIGNVSGVCPLQGYLFGSPEPTSVAKKENRTSLGELFQRSKVEVVTVEKDERRADIDGDKSITKKLKKRILGNSTAAAVADSASSETKRNKLLQMFHKKVHPESFTTMKKPSKLNKNDIKNGIPNDGGGYTNVDHNSLPDEEDTTTFHKISVSKERIRNLKPNSNATHFAIGRSDSNGNREYWIKTDAEYVVLEL